MVMASLAWNLKCWLALSLRESGRPQQKTKLKAEKHRLLRMDVSTFRQTMILIPTEIIRSARRLIFRLLAWSSSLETLFRLQDSLNLPLTTWDFRSLNCGAHDAKVRMLWSRRSPTN
jgi:hypothetical protein